MTAILITLARVAPGGQDALEQYATGTIPLIHAAGGEVISRLRLTDTVVGDSNRRPDLVAVMRFSSTAAIRGFLNGEEYRRQVPLRDMAFSEVHSYIAEDI